MTRVTFSEESPSPLDFTDLRLYGRELEIGSLEQAYRRSQDSSSYKQIVWVFGYSGAGKSALVDHCFQGKEKFYCGGKFDRFRSPQPYSALAALFTELCVIMSDFPPVRVSSEDASILLRIVPKMDNVLAYSVSADKTDEVTHKQEWAFEKVKEVFQKFLKDVCSVLPSPLIMFLDDLQWADVDTLEIVKSILTDDSNQLANLLFVGSYRDNEVDDSSPLIQSKKAIYEQCDSQNVTEIRVTDLSRSSVNQLVARITDMDLTQSQPLADLLHHITQGNAFFTLEMLRHIQTKNLLYVSKLSYQWEWKTEQIRLETGLSENVVDFISKRLQSLPLSVEQVLKVAACLGDRADVELLWLVLQSIDANYSRSGFANAIEIATNDNLIEVNDEKTRFKFSHDRIQAAAYELTPPGMERQRLHLKIGLCLQDRHSSYGLISADTQWEFVLAVDQFNKGMELIDDISERVDLARRNLLAGEEVSKTGSFKLSQSFLEVGLELLGVTRWEKEYQLALDLSSTLASVLFSNGSMDACLCLVEEIYTQARCMQDKHRAQFTHLEALASVDRLHECLDVGFRILKDLGHRRVPKDPSLRHIIPEMGRVKKLLRGMTDDDILSLPTCTDQKELAILRNLGFLAPIAFFANREDLIPILVCRGLQLMLRSGICEGTSYVFSGYSFAMGVIGQFEAATRFAKLSLAFMDRFKEDPRTLVMVCMLHHLKNPAHECIDLTLRSYHVAFAEGDLAFAGHACALHCAVRFVVGMNLKILEEDIFTFAKQMMKYNQQLWFRVLLVAHRSALEMTNRSEETAKLTGMTMDDEQFERFLESTKSDNLMFIFWSQTMITRFYLDNLDSAFHYATKCWKSKGMQGALVQQPQFYLFSGLTALDRWKLKPKMRYWRTFRKYHKILKSWRAKGNLNVGHLVSLLDAELAVSLKAPTSDIRVAFDKSISIASRSGFSSDSALANERAGRWYLTIGDHNWAAHYLDTSRELYREWNASLKVELMDYKYGHIIDKDRCHRKDSLTRRSISIKGRSRRSSIKRMEDERNAPILSLRG